MKKQLFPEASKYINNVIDHIVHHPDYFARYKGLEVWAAYVDNGYDVEKAVFALNQGWLNDNAKKYVIKTYKMELIAGVVKSLKTIRDDFKSYRRDHPDGFSNEICLIQSHILAKIDILKEIGIISKSKAKLLVDIVLGW